MSAFTRRIYAAWKEQNGSPASGQPAGACVPREPAPQKSIQSSGPLQPLLSARGVQSVHSRTLPCAPSRQNPVGDYAQGGLYEANNQPVPVFLDHDADYYVAEAR